MPSDPSNGNGTGSAAGSTPRRYFRGRVAPRNLPELKIRKRGVYPLKGEPIPEAWDSCAKGWVPPIKNQGSCGSCWDFSGTRVIEIALIKAGVLPPDGSQALSEQYTLDCYSNGGCNGDDNTTVLQHAQAVGLPRTKDYGDYTASSGTCRSTPSMTLYKIKQWGFADGARGDGVTATPDIQRAIMSSGCVGCAVAAGDGWDNYDGGEYGGSNNTGIDHDVTLTGWNPSKSRAGKVVWIMDNSWGEGWGDKGRMHILEGADLIGTEAVFAEVDGPGPSPPPPPPIQTCWTDFLGALASGERPMRAFIHYLECLWFHKAISLDLYRQGLELERAAAHGATLPWAHCLLALVESILARAPLIQALTDFYMCMRHTPVRR